MNEVFIAPWADHTVTHQNRYKEGQNHHIKLNENKKTWYMKQISKWMNCLQCSTRSQLRKQSQRILSPAHETEQKSKTYYMKHRLQNVFSSVWADRKYKNSHKEFYRQCKKLNKATFNIHIIAISGISTSVSAQVFTFKLRFYSFGIYWSKLRICTCSAWQATTCTTQLTIFHLMFPYIGKTSINSVFEIR